MKYQIIQSYEMTIGKIPGWWEVNGVIYKAHINSGFHLKIEPTCRKIEEMCYNLTNMKILLVIFILNVKSNN